MVSFSSISAFNNALIRKGLVGSVLIADYSTAALTDIATTGGALTSLTGYTSIGKLSSDGVAFSSTADVSEVRGWGDITSPSRIDVTGGSNSMTCTAIETKKTTWDAFFGVDMTSVTANANGTVTFDKPAVPVIRDKRVLFLAYDKNASTGLDIYYGIHFLRANLTQNGDQTFAGGDSVISYPLTINGLVDSAGGTAVRFFLGGPGVDTTLKTAMNF